MLNVGLTGGIGAGKSAVSARLVAHGAVLIDSDVLAREVVSVGSVGLSRVVEAFGDSIVDQSGALDRAKLAGLVFDDDAARRQLENIVHPLVRAAADERARQAAPDAIVVNDVPLLTETGLAPTFDLVMVVEAPRHIRVARLEQRGLPRQQADARIAAQTAEAERRAIADVVIDNSADVTQLHEHVDALWHNRLVPFETRKREATAASISWPPHLRQWDADWAERFDRLAARLRYVLQDAATEIEHVGATAVHGLAGRDIIDVQVTVTDLAAVRSALTAAGFYHRQDDPIADIPVHGAADPANLSRIQLVHADDSLKALSRRELLRGDTAAQREYEHLRRTAASGSPRQYQEAKENWWLTR